MLFVSQAFNYDHPWSHVVIGMWRKYPNPKCTHVVSVDVLDRSVDPITGVIRTERVIGCKQKAPKWIVKLFGVSEDAFVREVSMVDPATQQATTTSVNLSFSQFATCVERIQYAPLLSSDSSSSSSSFSSTSSPLPLSQSQSRFLSQEPPPYVARTRFVQTAEIQASMALWRTASDQLEQWLAQRFEHNAQIGKLAFTDVLRALWEERQQLQMQEMHAVAA